MNTPVKFWSQKELSYRYNLRSVEFKGRRELARNFGRIRAGQINFVDDRNNRKPFPKRKIKIGDGLGLDTLSCVDEEDCSEYHMLGLLPKQI